MCVCVCMCAHAYRDIIFSTCYNIGKLILLYLWNNLDSCQENLVALVVSHVVPARCWQVTVALKFIIICIVVED
jgi:hypothetical protein